MKIENLPEKLRALYRPISYSEAFATVIVFVMILLTAWYFTEGVPESKLLAVHPREWKSLPAILLFNFFHLDATHLINNLIFFVPLGVWTFKQEGARGVIGIFIGMLVAGAAVWLFGEGETFKWIFGQSNSVTVGFSGAVFACVGVLLVRSLRESMIQTIILLVLAYSFLELNTIQPSEDTEAYNISWLCHLGGLMGGMMAQIRSLEVALEMLYKQGLLTEKEFVSIATRIDASGAILYESKTGSEAQTETSVAANNDNDSPECRHDMT